MWVFKVLTREETIKEILTIQLEVLTNNYKVLAKINGLLEKLDVHKLEGEKI